MRPGVRVRLDAGGVDGGRVGVVLDPRTVPRNGRGVLDLPGEYRPWGSHGSPWAVVRLDAQGSRPVEVATYPVAGLREVSPC